MSDPKDETKPAPAKFDFSAYPPDSLFYDRRSGLERRATQLRAVEPAPAAPEAADAPRVPRARKDRRRRIDPTTFEKQYTDDEMEFMNAMQQFKMRSGKSFPSHGDVLRVATGLGYRRLILDDDLGEDGINPNDDDPSHDVVVMPCVPG